MTQRSRDILTDGGLGEVLRRNWLTILVVVIVAVVIALAHGWAETHLDWHETAGAELVQVGDPAKGQPLIQAWVDRAPLHVGEVTTLWLRLVNQTESPLSIQLEKLHHTQALQPLNDWAQATGTECEEREAAASFTLSPGAEKTFCRELDPVQSAASVTLAQVLTAGPLNRPAAARRWVLPIQELRIISLRTYLAQIVKSLVTLLGVLVLPTLGGLLAYGFQQRQQRMAQERDVWAKMMPTSHDNNAKYLIPFASSIRSFASNLAKARNQKSMDDEEEQWRRVFFFFLFVQRRYRVIVDEGAGFYLQSRAGEELVFELFYRYQNARQLYLGPEAEVLLDSLVDLMTVDETDSSYRTKLDDPKVTGQRLAYQELQEWLKRWLETESGTLAVSWLKISRLILMFEVNQVYNYWYGSPPDNPGAAVAEVEKEIPADALGKEERALLGRVKSYCEDARKIQKPPVSRALNTDAQGAPPTVSP